jgi:hypothetical protein
MLPYEEYGHLHGIQWKASGDAHRPCSFFSDRGHPGHIPKRTISITFVLDSDSVSRTCRGKTDKKRLLKDRITDINKHVQIDFIVYTKAEYNIRERNNASFLNGTGKTGTVM